PGEELNLHIELKLLADVGIIGYPSVGKSTLITILSNSRPKIADYPFTTLIPNLGVVSAHGINSFVLADMPGLIEGASQGAGLGIQFLKHIQRTRVLIHMVDMSPESTRDPYVDYLVINQELGEYDKELLKRPQIIVGSKMDMPGAIERFNAFKKHFSKEDIILPISALTNENLKELIYETSKLLEETPFFYKNEEVIDDHVEYVFEDKENEIIIEHVSQDTFSITGVLVEKLYRQSNLANEAAMDKFISNLRKAGLDQKLRESGAKSGDTVIIYDLEFDFVDE
ncbi:MAG TPA: Obg family GTPase CgtA, partial [Bacillota bacterium]|nr:Obg family GTPase CgtA [Bacillota bacterium]